MHKKIIAHIFIVIYGLSLTANAYNKEHLFLVQNFLSYKTGCKTRRKTSMKDRKINDLTNLDLSGIHMKNKNFLNYQTDEQADFTGTDFTGACLCGAYLLDVTLDNAILNYADLQNAHVFYESLSKVASRVGTKFMGAKIYQKLKNDAAMAYTVVKKSSLESSRTQDSNLEQSNIEDIMYLIKNTNEYMDLIKYNNPQLFSNIPKEISNFNLKQFNKKDLFNQEEEDTPELPIPHLKNNCPICLAQFKPHETISIFPCGHLIHPGCANIILSIKMECPECQQKPVWQTPVSKEEYNGFIELSFYEILSLQK